MTGPRLVGAYAVVTAILALVLTAGILGGGFRAIERSDYMTYQVAARIILAGDGACLYEPECQADAQRELIGEEPTFVGGALPFNAPPWLAAIVTPLGWLPLAAAFAIFTLLGLGVLLVATWRLAPAGWPAVLAPALVLTAWPTVMAAIRGQSTLLVVGLLGLSVALAPHRSGLALGLAALKPTLAPLWAAWQLTGGHWRAAATALITLAALVSISFVVVGPQAVIDYPGHLLGVAGADAVGVHPEEMVNWRGVAERLATGPWLTIAGTAVTLALVGVVWWRTRDRFLGAAAAFLATPLVIPHANQHEAVLGLLGVLVLAGAVRRAWLFAAAVTAHAGLWTGPLLVAEGAAWLLFMLLLGWLALAVLLAFHHPDSD